MPTILPSRYRASAEIKVDSRDDSSGDWIMGQDLHNVLGFCAIGLLISINVILRFPDLGAVIEKYNQF